MGKVMHSDHGKVIESLIQEFKGYAKTWITYISKIDRKKKVITFDGIAHCRRDVDIFVFYLYTAVIVVVEETSEWREAIDIFCEEYDLSFEDFKGMDRQQIVRLKENNPAALKDGQFLQSIEGLPRINATKIWDQNDGVIWHKH